MSRATYGGHYLVFGFSRNPKRDKKQKKEIKKILYINAQNGAFYMKDPRFNPDPSASELKPR